MFPQMWVGLNPADPFNKTQVLDFTRWTASWTYDRYSEQKSSYYSLTAGQKYYYEAYHKEGSGDDHFELGVVMPSITGKPTFASLR
eukprot:8150350-Pyramimonas_sp.AAC.1